GGQIADRLAVTVPLTLLAFVLAVVVAVPVGFLAAHRAGRWYGPLLSGFAQFGIAVPVFWIGMLLVTVFALRLRLLPTERADHAAIGQRDDRVQEVIL
uniref:ABC transporter permease subunit n=1 Tax=Nonomuraea rhizosphaerae TaxID=2665663 RepID=UPI001C5EBE6E